MGRRFPKPFGLAPTTHEARVKLIVYAGKLVGVKVTPRVARRLFSADPGALDPRARFKLNAYTEGFKIGEWLGVRVYLDVAGVLAKRVANGDGHD